MRVVSQDGKLDFPYENIRLSIADNSILCLDSFSTLATYSTEKKAQKAMEMLRNTYLSRMELGGGYDMVNGFYVQPNYWVLPKVFRFPQDSEVV